MRKRFKLSHIALFLVVLLSSCNDDGKKGDDTGSANSAATTSSSPSTNTGADQPKALAGALDILVAERTVFTNLNPGTKIVYSHRFGTDGKVHMSGWVLQGNTFPGNPMPLENGTPSNITYNDNTFFGNVVLLPADFNKIRNALIGDQNLQYVLFFPKIVDTYFIGYDIYPSVAKLTTITAGLIPTAEANPSPPRIY
jgi:hypothetical protein